MAGDKRTGVIRNYRVGDVFSDYNSVMARLKAKRKRDQEEKSEEQSKDIVSRETITLEKGLSPFLSPQTRQINAPHRTPAEVLRPYLQHNKVVVFFHATKRPVTARLSGVQAGHLTAEIDNKDAVKLVRWKGEPVAVLFQTEDQRRYLLQTHVKEIFTTVITLSYIEPLHSFNLPDGWSEATSLSFPPTPVVENSNYKGATFERETTQGKVANHKLLKGVVDLLDTKPSQNEGQHCCQIHNISLGGMSLTDANYGPHSVEPTNPRPSRSLGPTSLRNHGAQRAHRYAQHLTRR